MLDISHPRLTSGAAVVSAPAEIDIVNAEQLRIVLRDAGRPGHPAVVVDMTGTWFCDSEGFSVLIAAHKQALAEGGGLRLVIPTDSPVLRDRLLGNARVLFGIEMAAYLAYDPAPGQLAAIRVPRAVTAGAGNRDIGAAGQWRYEAARWLAARLQTTLIELPGAHMGYLGQPEHFAKALRPILDRLT